MSNDLAAISTNEEPDIDHYKLLNTIGQGSFAKVRLARHSLMGTDVAVKVIHQQGSCRHLEFHCLRVLNYPNTVKLFEVIETQKTLYLVMERVHRLDMHGYLTNHDRLNENKAQGIFRQLVSALEYCHQRGIVHWNLKPENVLLDSEWNANVRELA
ncbi:hypothetical protein mRhiFer1_010296 [Rhinolophus ferrumequinum]|uniref:non-specific serine/threonine protein kinase n=1 Tax=Rhinolophus ferrumequinum TaxID=59479 RepID=A0A7J7X5P9_RHIFE|nr:hypothetical protein mRhiFer1_010296 [Rhinolophus ferrumequinum]